MQEEWNEFKNYILKYEEEHRPTQIQKDRYCVAIACEDLIEKMEEIEEKWGKNEENK